MQRLAALACFAAAAASPVAAQNAMISDKLDEVIAAAKREGTINLVWSASAVGDERTARQYIENVNRVFGTNLSYRFSPGPEMPRQGNLLFAELGAGLPSSSDIYVGSPLALTVLVPQNMFINVPWTRLAPGRIVPELVEGGGAALRLMTDFAVIAYNTRQMPNPPNSMEGLLAPEWKGRLATTPYAAGFDVLLADDFWGRQRTLDYVKRLLPQVGGVIRCSETERILTGEYAAFVIDCSSHGPEMWKSRGAPIDYFVPDDAAQVRYFYATIPRNARHPNAAALLCLYLLSAAGQDLLWKATGLDLESLPGSHTGAVVRRYEARGTRFKNVTADWWMRHPEISPA
jgi:iron(III) transport system substrate-binding protein